LSHTAMDLASADQDITLEASLCAAFQRTVARVPDRVALRTLGDGVSITWRQYAERVDAIARGLAALGVGPGDAVALMLVNRPEFHLADTAALHLGALTVSIYNTLPPADIAYILRDSGANVLITEAAFMGAIRKARAESPLEHVVVVDGDAGEDAITLAEVESARAHGTHGEGRWRDVGPDDLAVVIYTSGTTGPPKGVELTHGAVLGNVEGMHRAIGTRDGARVISLLPMAHIAERQFSHYRAMGFGFTVTCCPNPREIVDYLQEVRPHYFFSPPRLFEKFRAGIEAGLAADDELSAPARRALELGRRRLELEAAGEDCAGELTEELGELQRTVGHALLARFGLEEVDVALTGAAPVPPDLVAFWVALGLPLLEAWGLSESGAFGAFNRPDDVAVGTVGKALPGVEIRLADDGEILLRSPWLMRGYRNLPEQTSEAIDAEGWLHTGDVGAWDGRGHLRIIDRKKELIINAAGKNMSPANIESKLTDAHPLIGQACVIGNGRPYNVALIVLDPEAAVAFSREIGREGAPAAELSTHAQVEQAVAQGVAAANERLSRVEQVKRYKVLAEEWLPGGDELTPTMKLKRNPIAEKYAGEIDALYAS
jgi:long-chain acyl-CoA synthetase